MTYGDYFFLSLALTIVVEIPLLIALSKYVLHAETPSKKIFCWGLFANLFSFPYLWFVFPLFLPLHNYVYIGETLVVLIEMAILSWGLNLNLKNAFILSLLANIASYCVGAILLK
jgi:hypothetical protein